MPPPSWPGFQATSPRTRLNLLIGNRMATIESLADHQADVVVRDRPPEDMELDQAEIADHPHIIVARRTIGWPPAGQSGWPVDPSGVEPAIDGQEFCHLEWRS